MFKCETIDVAVFKWLLEVVVTDECDVLKRQYGYDCDSILGVTLTITNGENKKVAIVINPEDEEYDSAIVAHEACHAAATILQSIGQRADYDNDEVFSYLTEYIMREVLRVVDLFYDENSNL